MISDIFSQKEKLRKNVNLEKKKYTEHQLKFLSNQIFNRLEQLENFKAAKTILAYWSINGEVFTHTFINKWKKEKKILLPVIKGNDLELKPFKDENKLKKNGQLSLLEPDGPTFNNYDEIDLAIIPGIAFDRNNNRMGRGKAYYDRFLSQTNVFKVGICFPFQYFEEIPYDKYDIKMDTIIC